MLILNYITINLVQFLLRFRDAKSFGNFVGYDIGDGERRSGRWRWRIAHMKHSLAQITNTFKKVNRHNFFLSENSNSFKKSNVYHYQRQSRQLNYRSHPKLEL